jgi:hypothetical protein
LAGACLGQLLVPEVACAAFHAWDITEVYSSADGSVQFIEMRMQFGGQTALSCCGTRITATNSGGTTDFIFGTNLPFGAGLTCLIGTTNLASIPGGVTPNYVIPPNFIRRPIGGGSAALIFSGNGSQAVFSSLPTDGRSALLRSGSPNLIEVNTNSPQNFSDQANSIVPVKFETARANGGNFVVSFATATGPNGSAGPNYAIEARDLVGASTWSTATNVTGDGTTKAVAIPFVPGGDKFFRLRVP